MKYNNIGKMFGVLVIGGSMMAQANELGNTEKPLEEPHCQLETVLKKYNLSGNLASSKITCIDSKSDEEIAQIIKENRGETCISPFCGCWLG